jgi:hypothetical protein
MAKKRTMTDVEVGLARAMLAKGMKNDQVHFYFNRVDRLISSGRIAQIKEGSYAKDVGSYSCSIVCNRFCSLRENRLQPASQSSR